jgi:hypothetical protein
VASAGSGKPPAWVWWLIAAAGLAVVIAAVLLIRRASRRRAWASRFATGREDVTWLTRTVVPQLASEPSTAQMAQGWRIVSARLPSIDDGLARLEATAPDAQRALSARTLRGAVLSARSRIDRLLMTADVHAARAELTQVRGELEAALASLDRPPPTGPGAHT